MPNKINNALSKIGSLMQAQRIAQAQPVEQAVKPVIDISKTEQTARELSRQMVEIAAKPSAFQEERNLFYQQFAKKMGVSDRKVTTSVIASEITPGDWTFRATREGSKAAFLFASGGQFDSHISIQLLTPVQPGPLATITKYLSRLFPSLGGNNTNSTGSIPTYKSMHVTELGLPGIAQTNALQ